MKPHATRDLVAPLALGVLVLLGWWATTAFTGVESFMLPGPPAVATRLAADLGNPDLWGYLATTLAEAVGGCLLGAAVALPLAVTIHRSVWFSAAVQPFLGATQAIPAIALAPLLVLWVDYGFNAIITLCALMVFFPILISTVVGLSLVDPHVVEAARIDGAGQTAVLMHIEGPLAMPSMLAGLRNGFTLSVTGAVVGEMVMGGQGMGTVLTAQRDAVDTTGMFASIIVLCFVASAFYVLIRSIERRSDVVSSLVQESR